jgi:hypothetical protein
MYDHKYVCVSENTLADMNIDDLGNYPLQLL